MSLFVLSQKYQTIISSVVVVVVVVAVVVEVTGAENKVIIPTPD